MYSAADPTVFADAIQQGTAGVTKVQTKNCTFTASSGPTCQFTSNVASGDVGVAAILTTVNTIGVTTVSDGANTYALVASDSVLTAVGLNAVYCWNYASLGTTPTITFTLGAAATGGIILYDLSGAAGQCHITGADDSIGESALSSSPAVASYTPSSAGYEIGFLNVATTTPTVTAGGGQTKDNDATSSTMRLASESIANTGTATTTPFTLSVAGAWNEVSVTFVSTPEVTVTQPLVLCVMESGAPTGTSFSMFGAGVFLRTLFSSALPCTTMLNVVADKNSPITIESPTDGASTRHRFNSSSDSTVTAVVTTCNSGTCGNKRLDVYYELGNTYQITPNAQATWDSGLSTLSVIGTVTGAAASTATTIVPTSGGGAQTSVGWTDYNTAAVIGTSTITGAPSNSQWVRNGACSFTQTTGANTDNCDYWKQWTNNFLYTSSHGSPTAPILTCNSIGAGSSITLTLVSHAFWCDHGATASGTDPTTGSTSAERWTDNGQSFAISAGGATDTFAYYDQLQNTYKATQVSPTTWDGIFTITVIGTQFGVAGTTGCSAITTVPGATAQCSSWFDYNTAVTMLSPIPVSATEQWKQSSGPSGNVLTDTTGSNTRNVNYGRQWQVTMSASPSVGGAVSPATGFFNDGLNGTTYALSQAANPGYAFAQPWTSSSASVTFDDATSSAPTMTVKAAATVTATFVEVSLHGGGGGQGGGPNSFPSIATTSGLATTWSVGPDGKTTTRVFQQGPDTAVLSGNLASLVIIAVVLGVLVFLNARKNGYTPSYKRTSKPDYHRPR